MFGPLTNLCANASALWMAHLPRDQIAFGRPLYDVNGSGVMDLKAYQNETLKTLRRFLEKAAWKARAALRGHSFPNPR